jgi:hypothetical protein
MQVTPSSRCVKVPVLGEETFYRPCSFVHNTFFSVEQVLRVHVKFSRCRSFSFLTSFPSEINAVIYPQELRCPCDISSAVTLPVRYILGNYVTREIYPQQLSYPCDISSAGYVPHPFGYNSPQQIIVSVWRTKFKFAGSGVVAR